MVISRLVFIASLVTCIRSYADTTITGRVTDAYGECVPDASLYLQEYGSTSIIEYCETDTHGEYTLKYAGSSDSLTLVLSGFGIKTQTCSIANCSQTVNFVTSVTTIDIKEVTVVADRVTQHGDTLSYIVEAFKLPTDRTIGDVIKNMPGLQVDDSGRISFNGKEISNFYVENLDLLEGKYGIGTNNIHASDIASVQIYQNHKPIKALSEWDYDQKVAVNLTLKPHRRGTFSINGMASAGAVPFLWGGELTAMYFTKLFQTISFYKGNNTGEDFTKELTDYKNNELAPLPPASLQLVQPIPPEIPAKRYVQNKTHVANTNNIIKIDSVTTLDVAVSYENSIFGKAGEYIEKRLVEGAEIREIAQNMTTESHTDRLSIFGTYKINSTSLYLVNNFSAKSAWDSGNGMMSFPGNNAQKLLQRINDKTSVSINDNFNFVHSQGDRKWEAQIRAGYARRPQTLSVEPSNMLGVGDESSNVIAQRFIREIFRISASSFYSYRAGIFDFSGSLYGRADVESVKSDLDGTIFASNNAKNDFRFNSYMLEGQLSGVANLSRFWRLSLTLPLLLEFQANKNNLDKASHFRTDLRVNPLFKIIFTPDLNHNVSLTGVYNSYKDFSNFFENGIIMHSYLDFSSREPYTWSGYHQYEARAEYSYRNTMYEFFGDANASFVHTKRNTLDYITYNGIVTETRLMQKSNNGNRGNIALNLSKGVSAIKSVLKAGVTAGFQRDWTVVQTLPVKYTSSFWFTKLSWALQPVKWISSTFTGAYGEQSAHISNGMTQPVPIRQSTLRADITAVPIAAVDLSLGVEDSYSNSGSYRKNIWFGDFKGHYRCKSGEFGIEINNIFNRRLFTRVVYNGVTQYQSIYRLRGRSFVVSWRYRLL